jgi:lysophospholipase L1-like esterase
MPEGTDQFSFVCTVSLEKAMASDLMSSFAMLLALIGPPPLGEPDLNMPSGLILRPGAQIIAIGDSITEAGGYLRAVDTVLAARYPELKLPPIKNAGIGGQKAEDLVKRFQADVIDRKPAVVTISIGINDVWHRADERHEPRVLARYWVNVALMVELAQSAGIRVILLTPTLIHENPDASTNKRLRIYVEAEKQIARERNCTLVDLHAMFLAAIAKRPADVKNKENWLTIDGVHMSPLGDTLMAIGVLRALGVPDRQIAPAASPVQGPSANRGP